MNRSCRSRRLAALFAMISLLFMQLALAGYQCPDEALDLVSQQSESSEQSGSPSPRGCDGMDIELPGLCYAHAQAGNQSLDKPVLPLVQPFTEAGHPVVAVDFTALPTPLASRGDANFLLRTVAPAIAVRNCCFRI